MKYVMVLAVMVVLSAQEARHNAQYDTLVIADAMVIVGVGTPVEGPYDIVIVKNKIDRITRARSNSRFRKQADAIIDAKGKYVLPGFINMHGHIMYSRGGLPMDQPYQYYLWLSNGITTVRDLGSDYRKSSIDREKSKRNEIIAPRLYLYPGTWGSYTPADARKRIRDLKKNGADGVKFGMMDKETFYAAHDEANKLGLKVANHVGVEDMNAWDNAKMGTTTIEHWYGVPEAGMHHVQNFPPDMNYSNELDRFRYAGRLWRETDEVKLTAALKMLVDRGVAWDPTLAIYEASRDLQRYMTSPWYQDYLHPGLERFFKPNPESHGSYFWGWTHTDEVYWKENYQIWYKALREFSRLGGTITTGEDAGYIYQLYGFGYLRELQLHEEAGFKPLEVIKHATVNSAKVLGMEGKLGKVKVGYLADLIVVNANPVADLQSLLPRGIKPITIGPKKGGIEWTIKDGFTYHAPTMLKEVRKIVKDAREKNPVNYLTH